MEWPHACCTQLPGPAGRALARAIGGEGSFFSKSLMFQMTQGFSVQEMIQKLCEITTDYIHVKLQIFQHYPALTSDEWMPCEPPDTSKLPNHRTQQDFWQQAGIDAVGME